MIGNLGMRRMISGGHPLRPSVPGGGSLQWETTLYLGLPGVSLTGAQIAQVDTYIRAVKYGSGATIASVTLNLSTATSYYFLTRSSVDLRWAALISGATISVAATGTPATTAVFGGLSQGTGETVGVDLITGWTNEDSSYETFVSSGSAITSAVNSASIGYAVGYTGGVALALYKVANAVTVNSGQTPTFWWGDSAVSDGPSFTANTTTYRTLTPTTSPSGARRFRVVSTGSANFSLTSITTKQVLTADLSGISASALTNGGINPNSATYVLTVTKP